MPDVRNIRPHLVPIVPRDASNSSSSKLPTSTIIAIVVAVVCIVLLVFALFAYRFVSRWCRRSRNVPLPPVQDLAHHREQQLASFVDRNSRPTTWVDPQLFQQKPRVYSSHFLSVSGSSASLIRSSPDFTSRGPTRENSWGIDDAATSAESSAYPTPLLKDDLLPPTPSFLPSSKNPHNSMTSVVSSSSDGISDRYSPMPASPSDLNHSVESSGSLAPIIPGNNANGGSRPRPPRGSRSRPRPVSLVSSSGTVNSMKTSHSTSANALRGPAHSIHSNIQIILPTPLAPDLYPHMQRPSTAGSDSPGRGSIRSSSFYGGGTAGDRRSIVDGWVLAGSRSQIDLPRSESQGVTSTGSRPPYHRAKSSLSNAVSSASLRSSESTGKPRRALSQPPPPHGSPASASGSRSASPSHSRSSSASMSIVASPSQGRIQSRTAAAAASPPVPRVPSMYKNGSADTLSYAAAPDGKDGELARPVLPASDSRPVSMATSASGSVKAPPPSAFSMPRTPESPSKLRKSRSGSVSEKRRNGS